MEQREESLRQQRQQQDARTQAVSEVQRDLDAALSQRAGVADREAELQVHAGLMPKRPSRRTNGFK